MGELGILKERKSLCPTWLCWDFLSGFDPDGDSSPWFSMNFTTILGSVFSVIYVTLQHGFHHTIGENICFKLAGHQTHHRFGGEGESSPSRSQLLTERLSKFSGPLKQWKLRPSIFRGNVSFSNSKGSFFVEVVLFHFSTYLSARKICQFGMVYLLDFVNVKHPIENTSPWADEI